MTMATGRHTNLIVTSHFTLILQANKFKIIELLINQKQEVTTDQPAMYVMIWDNDHIMACSSGN